MAAKRWRFFIPVKNLAEASSNMRVIDRYIKDLNRRLAAINWRSVPKKKGNPGGGTPPPPPKWP